MNTIYLHGNDRRPYLATVGVSMRHCFFIDINVSSKREVPIVKNMQSDGGVV